MSVRGAARRRDSVARVSGASSVVIDRRISIGIAVALGVAAPGCRTVPAEAPVAAARSEPVGAGAPDPRPGSLATPDAPRVSPLPRKIRELDGDGRTIDLGGGWSATIRPAEITAEYGDEVAFTVEVRADRRGSGRPVPMPLDCSTRVIPGASTEDARGSSSGATFRAIVTVGPERWSSAPRIGLKFTDRTAVGSLSYAELPGPRLHRGTTRTLVPVHLRELADRCDLPPGLSVSVQGRTVEVFYSSGPISAPDWVAPAGDFVVRRIDGRITLVGFIHQADADHLLPESERPRCPGATSGTPDSLFSRRFTSAVSATFEAPEPGPVDVVVFAEQGGRAQRHATAVPVDWSVGGPGRAQVAH